MNETNGIVKTPKSYRGVNYNGEKVEKKDSNKKKLELSMNLGNSGKSR